MKPLVTVLLVSVVALLVATSTTNAARFNAQKLRAKFFDGNTAGNTFVRSLKHLHREPPMDQAQTRASATEHWIEQPVDHFDADNKDTWQMRYMANDEHFQAGGPIFIYLGGEWAISPGRITIGYLYDLAKEHNAMLYYTEHRYYGQSKPKNDITVDNLKYLHVKQALADLVCFLEQQRANNPALANAKVIMAGGSYSATMVVWFKHLYPELLAGGWASSAPLLAKVDYKEYKEVVGRAMQVLGGQQCYNRIQNGIAELQDMFANKRGAEAKAMLKLCNNFNEHNDLDLWSLFSTLSNLFSGVVQYQADDDVAEVCGFLMQQEDDVSAIASFLLLYLDSGCIDVTYKDTLNYYMDSTYAAGVSRPWYYQTCNEYGWYQSSGSRDQPFGNKFPATLYTTLCSDIFGASAYSNENINAHADQTNVDFGGMSPNIERIHMTHGELDPWNAVGHTAAEGAVILPLASHCTDFGSISAADTPEMRASKERLAQLVREWLSDDADKQQR